LGHVYVQVTREHLFRAGEGKKETSVRTIGRFTAALDASLAGFSSALNGSQPLALNGALAQIAPYHTLRGRS
jgi:hypothetical protein